MKITIALVILEIQNKDHDLFTSLSREMSDVLVLACDENWWFGDTVKDYSVSVK